MLRSSTLTAALLLLLTAATALPLTPPPSPLSWALLISASSDPADSRHAAGALALGATLKARRCPVVRLFVAAPTPVDGWDPTVAALVSPGHPTLPFISAAGADVTPGLVLAALTATHPPWHPPSWRLPLGRDPSATALIFLTGHGGPGFIRIGGGSLTSVALARGLATALQKGLAGRILLLADTCRAASLVPSPPPLPLTFIASAAAEESSHSSGFWTRGGPGGYRGATAERFTAALMGALESPATTTTTTTTTLGSLLVEPGFAPSALLSTPSITGNASWTVADFFGVAVEAEGDPAGGGCVS